MPISQDRMLALINAAQDYQQALQQACKYVKLAAENSTSPERAFAEMLRLGSLVYESGLLRQPLTSHTLIATEDQHFRKEKGKNIRRAEKIREKRAEGKYVSHRATSPRTIYRAPEPVSGISESEQRAKGLESSDALELVNFKFQGLDPLDKAKIEREALAEEERERWEEEYKKAAPVPAPVQAPAPTPAQPKPTHAPNLRNARGKKIEVIGPLDAPGLYDPPDDTPPMLSGEAIAKEGE